MPVAQTQANAKAEIVTELLETRVLITCMRGFITAAVCAQSFDQFRAQANDTSGATWIIDTMAITGFQPSAVQVGARWFDVFKTRAGQQIIMVSDILRSAWPPQRCPSPCISSWRAIERCPRLMQAQA